MCGIAGLFAAEGIRAEDLTRMSRKIAHRGPDGEGFVYFSDQSAFPAASEDTRENCIGQQLLWSPVSRALSLPEKLSGGFAHRRLSIIDLEATGHQPMCSADGRYWITFNGEIYNYIELRAQLKQQGAVFITQSDTEVILHAWQIWGEACLHRFNGMWAFSIYDTHTQTLFASRDRFGVKPFYYTQSGKRLAFASEQKALLSLPWLPFQVNPDAVFDYFVFGQIEFQPQGFLEGILELPAGQALTFSLLSGQLHVKPWYALEVDHSIVPWEKSTHEKHVQRVQELLSEAVRIRLRADVPVGSCLSGGLDSSAIVGWMRKHLGEKMPLHVYTAAFPGTPVDESSWAKIMADWVQAEQHTILPDVDALMRDMEALTRCQDVPIWSTSTYAQYRVMQGVKASGIKVVLDGQGGDEVFGGYEPHRSFYWKGLPYGEMLKAMQQGNGLLANMKFHMHQQARYEYAFRMPAGMRASFFKNYFPENAYLNPALFEHSRKRFELQTNSRQPDLNGRLAYEMQNTSLKGYLRCEDRCAMWHGIESRTPFADDVPLIEYLFSVPAVYKMHGSRLKALLRDASAPVLPQAILNRSDKQGYTTPNNAWIKSIAPHFREHFNSVLAPFLDVKKINTEYEKLFHPRTEGDTGRIFKFISFALWMKLLGEH